MNMKYLKTYQSLFEGYQTIYEINLDLEELSKVLKFKFRDITHLDSQIKDKIYRIEFKDRKIDMYIKGWQNPNNWVKELYVKLNLHITDDLNRIINRNNFIYYIVKYLGYTEEDLDIIIHDTPSIYENLLHLDLLSKVLIDKYSYIKNDIF